MLDILRAPHTWPHNPFCPVAQGLKCGVVALLHEVKPVVFICSLERAQQLGIDGLNACERVHYNSLSELIADGWRIL